MREKELSRGKSEAGEANERLKTKKNFPYADLLDRKRPVSTKHPPMSIHDRAAQFSAFAALSGHGKAIRKTEKLVEEKVALEVERRTEEEAL